MPLQDVDASLENLIHFSFKKKYPFILESSEEKEVNQPIQLVRHGKPLFTIIAYILAIGLQYAKVCWIINTSPHQMQKRRTGIVFF